MTTSDHLTKHEALPVRILIVDDQPIVRSGLAEILAAHPDLEVVGEAGDGCSALEQAVELRPDVVLMDIRMPRLDGIEATREIVRQQEDLGAAVLVLTTFDLDEYVFGALEAGASGFLLKDSDPELLVHGVRSVARGDSLVSPAVTRRLIEAYVGRRSDTPAQRKSAKGPWVERPLSLREREVLLEIARGLPNKEIGSVLGISLPTVKTHIASLMTKIGARNRVELVIHAYECGLVGTLDPPHCG